MNCRTDGLPKTIVKNSIEPARLMIWLVHWNRKETIGINTDEIGGIIIKLRKVIKVSGISINEKNGTNNKFKKILKMEIS